MRKFFYCSSIVFLIIALFLLNMLYAKINLQYTNNKEQLNLLNRTAKNNKDIGKNIYYNNIIHIANKYNGEIKEFKSKNNNINTIISISVNENSINEILDKLKQEKTIKKLNSLALEKKGIGSEDYIILLNADFLNSDT
ncbi:hypothetical protein CPAST_c18880 [Clostridium pasteurianum DSM 525 = ATCC 6013]|uniref:Uncharacterized protein n=1 Tax=Clostridium pasteurianum DSM 525 = ATCC 6013 TaxID=1262449 RepID=A0A0H3J7R9_CLOPA|nr:hypothetical protein [Clostridium pasteurianum]AJA47958.1 hypothetical protein CPAST_c18880 [Clostridium pasteurianum DSM 525 = ATCC 6013]AJA51946.1 hypothetical protein CLPA_c18880 [Clostridium pasteurianum DSM 525 = ATCC 6013]AOZ75245.1 hypothetical protein AQ983_09165 [Clostridium pasteurianum DSM 525 = ATCC 6013]AOZ79040.1 hypothetical protein AQ984_09155 [Clostridium pasteurianum]ELP59861.1 hypothetical protein F502_08348 [Clostridium pasteurianum DSM 525 = ATCC 6013]